MNKIKVLKDLSFTGSIFYKHNIKITKYKYLSTPLPKWNPPRLPIVLYGGQNYSKVYFS